MTARGPEALLGTGTWRRQHPPHSTRLLGTRGRSQDAPQLAPLTDTRGASQIRGEDTPHRVGIAPGGAERTGPQRRAQDVHPQLFTTSSSPGSSGLLGEHAGPTEASGPRRGHLLSQLQRGAGRRDGRRGRRPPRGPRVLLAAKLLRPGRLWGREVPTSRPPLR